MIETINKMNRISRQILQETGQEPDPRVAGGEDGDAEEKIRKILKISKEPISMETPIGDDDDSHLGDFHRGPVHRSRRTRRRCTRACAASPRDVLDTLTPREAKVLRMRFGHRDEHRPHAGGKSASSSDVTRERIRRSKPRRLRKLRHPSRSERLSQLFSTRRVENRGMRAEGWGMKKPCPFPPYSLQRAEILCVSFLPPAPSFV